MNAYIDLDTIKSGGVLNIQNSLDDSRLLRLIEAASRHVDRLCNRHFYTHSATRTFDGDGGTRLWVPDLIAITTLKEDADKDRTFEVTWASTDYLLWPNNAAPTVRGNSDSKPYLRIDVDLDAGTQDVFTQGRQTIQLAAFWGYWRHLKRATETATVADASTTTVTLSEKTDVQVGHTLKLDSEQVYVRSAAAAVLTVDRGVNGTTAASHSAGTAVDIYEYPDTIREATLMLMGRWFARRNSNYANVVGFADGGMNIFRGLDDDVKLLLMPYRKLTLPNWVL